MPSAKKTKELKGVLNGDEEQLEFTTPEGMRAQAEAQRKITANRRDWLAAVFNLPDGIGVDHVKRTHGETGLEYGIKLSSGDYVVLGRARDVLKHGKCAEAFAEEIGHVIPGKEKKDWEAVAQSIFDVEKKMRAEFGEVEDAEAAES